MTFSLIRNFYLKRVIISSDANGSKLFVIGAWIDFVLHFRLSIHWRQSFGAAKVKRCGSGARPRVGLRFICLFFFFQEISFWRKKNRVGRRNRENSCQFPWAEKRGAARADDVGGDARHLLQFHLFPPQLEHLQCKCWCVMITQSWRYNHGPWN